MIKKILTAFIFLLLPVTAFAANSTVPWWYATTTNTIFQYPNGTINVGISTSTAPEKLSVQGNGLFSGNVVMANLTATGTATVNGSASSTFLGGVDVARICIKNTTTCLAAAAAGGVTSVATNNGITGGTITTTGTIGLDLTKIVNNTLLIYNGSQLQATGTQQLTVGNLLATTTDAANTMSSFLNIGSAPFLTQAMISMSSTSNNWIQAVIQNRTAASNASTLFAVQNDKGTNTSYFGEFGINSSLFNQAAFSGQGAGDVYLFSSDSSIDIGTASSTAGNASTSINFFTKGTVAASQRATILGTGEFGIATTTPSRTLSVHGNTLISGDIVSVANITATGTMLIAGPVTSASNLKSTFPYASTTALTVTNSATSTVITGSASVLNLAVTGPSAGCAQIGAGGYLQSTGSACAAAGSGKTMDLYAATSSIFGGGTPDYPLATTTSISFPGSILVWATCSSRASGVNLDANTTQGTTTLASLRATVNGGDTDKYGLTLFGLYTSTTSVGSIKFSITDTSDGILAASGCSASAGGINSIMFQRFTN